MSKDPCEEPLTQQAWAQVPMGAHPVGQGGACTRLGVGPQCVRFLYGLAFGLSRSLAFLSPDMADGSGQWEGAAARDAGCLPSCPTAATWGQTGQNLSAARDRDW